MSRSTALLLVAILAASEGVSIAQPVESLDVPTMEAYPDGLVASIETRDRFLVSLPPTVDGMGLQQVFTETRKWLPGSTVTVAFLGGDSSLHKDIADATKDWTSHCNLKLDFGLTPATGKYRTWSTEDTGYTADIRVSFDHGGYWSLVGTDSRNPALGQDGDGGGPNQRSLNLGGLNLRRPANWRGVALHEFGHALGFQHEHQHPAQGCDADFRWYDDPQYMPTKGPHGDYVQDGQGKRPGIYTVLGGYPNLWPQSKVDFNLRQLPESHAFSVTDFDKASIMKYYFPPWMFVQGAQSHCFNNGENLALSPNDIKAVSVEYPGGPQATALIAQRKALLRALLEVQNLNAIEKQHFQERLDTIK